MTSVIPAHLSIWGGARLVWRLSLPLMISAMSLNLMHFTNRVVMARYDIEALNVASMMWISVGVFGYTMFAIASITEVFVGQAHGAHQEKQIGPLVWQMLWVTMLLSLVAVPIFWALEGLIMPDALSEDAHRAYLIAPIPACFQGLSAALMGFFIGRGHVRIITAVVLAINVLNVGLTIPFVFGINDWFAGMGLTGTMWACCVAQAIQLLILSILFLQKKNQKMFATHQWAFRYHLALVEVSKAIPAAMSHFFEIAAWAVLFRVIAACGHEHWTVQSLNHGVWFLFGFASDGLRQGMIAASANACGARNHKAVKRILQGGFVVVTMLTLLIAIPLVLFPAWAIQCFLPGSQPELSGLLATNMIWLWLFIVGDGFAWVLVGLLTGAGDTRWVMISNIVSVTVLCVLPVVALIEVGWLQNNAWAVGLPSAFYGFGNALLMFWRYKRGAWRTLNLVAALDGAKGK